MADDSAFPRLAILGASVLALSACGDEPIAVTPWERAHRNAIVGGEEELGYLEVGALVYREWFSFQTVCTATLIKPDWIITAAHCLREGLDNLSFVVGTRANWGRHTSLADAVIHPRYDSVPIGSIYDIALVRLASSLSNDIAEPTLYSTTPLEPYVGASTVNIGYGTTSGTNSVLGLGRKRRVDLPIARVDPLTYSHVYEGRGVCVADSGGPAFLEIDGQPQIVGITSAAYGCQGDTCAPCTNGSKHTRVDVFSDWIASVVGDAFQSCATDAERCLCRAACGNNGVCDHALCGTHSCSQITGCLFGPCADSADGACSTSCIDDGSIAARETLRTLVDCWAENCRGIVGSHNERQCLVESCDEPWALCQEQRDPGTPPADDPPPPADDPSPPADDPPPPADDPPPPADDPPPPADDPPPPADNPPPPADDETSAGGKPTQDNGTAGDAVAAKAPAFGCVGVPLCMRSSAFLLLALGFCVVRVRRCGRRSLSSTVAPADPRDTPGNSG